MPTLNTGEAIPDNDFHHPLWGQWLQEKGVRRRHVETMFSLPGREERKAYVASVRKAEGHIPAELLKQAFIAEHEEREKAAKA